MASALEKLRDHPTAPATPSRATAHLWFAAPLAEPEAQGGRRSWRDRLHDTHPTLEQRIARLRAL